MLRLRCGDVDTNGPGFKYEVMQSAIDGVHACLDQEIRPGSCAIIEHGGALVPHGDAWSFGAYIYPTRIADNARGIMGNWCESTARGYALEIDAEGHPVLVLGSTRFTLQAKARQRVWSFLSATLDFARGAATLSLLVPADGISLPPRIQRPSRCLRNCRWSQAWISCLPPTTWMTQEIHRPFRRQDRSAARVFGCAGGRGTAGLRLETAHGCHHLWPRCVMGFRRRHHHNGREGCLGQLPERTPAPVAAPGVTGFFWSGAVHDFRLAPSEYAAIHFHSDDIYDCQWQTTFSLAVPDDWRTGVYALRLTPAGDNSEPIAKATSPSLSRRQEDQTRRPRRRHVVATYLAYANSALRLYQVHFETLMEHVLWLPLDDVYMQEHPEIGQSTYDCHVDGSGRAYSSWLRPVLSMRPRGYWFNLINDTHILDWLEEKGIAYDIITDVELDREGARALRPYRAMMTPTHAEYYSFNMMNGIMEYQNAGGRHISMGGNAFYWRCGFHPAAPAALEVRRGMAARAPGNPSRARCIWLARESQVHSGATAALPRRSLSALASRP